MWLKRLVTRKTKQSATDDGALRTKEHDSTGRRNRHPLGAGHTTTLGPNFEDPVTRDPEVVDLRKGLRKNVRKKNHPKDCVQ